MIRQKRGKSQPLVWLSLVCVILLVAVVYWLVNQDAAPEENPLTTEQARQLVRLADEALVCLENEDFRDGFELAEQRLDQISSKIPESRFVYRNRVIGRLLFFRKNKAEYQDNQEFIGQTTRLVEELIEKEPDYFVPYLLAVRWRYELSNDITELDVELLETAIANARLNPIPYYEFYDKTSILDDQDLPGIVDKRQKHLAKAYELQPDNIKLAMLYLQQLAEQKSELFVETWTEFLAQLSPLIVSADLELFETSQQEYVSKINEAALAKDWTQILLGVRRLSNLIKRGEVQKIDLARIQPYELEFLKTELEREIVEKANRDLTATKPIPPKFQFISLPVENTLSAVRVLDYDLDDQLEILALSENELAVYEKSDDEKWSVASRTPLAKKYTGLLAADLDYDKRSFAPGNNEAANTPRSSTNYSDPDLILYGPDGLDIFENKLDGQGKRILERVEPGDMAGVTGITAATLVDIDHDKDLDLIVAGDSGLRLFLSRGNLSFYDFSKHSTFPSSATKVISLDIVDLDRDIDIDILVAFENGNSGYLENLGHSQLRFRRFDPSMESIENGRQCYAVEMDGHPSWDILCSSPDGIALMTTQTVRSSVKRKALNRIEAVTQPIRSIADFNNDGFLDCVCGNGEGSALLLGDGISLSEKTVQLKQSFVQADAADLNSDGKMDLVCVSGDGKSIQLCVNQTETDNQWIELSVCGRDSNFPKGRINNHAIGSFVELQAGSYYFATTVKQPRLHFGLGQNKTVDLIRFLWTSGMPQSLFKVESGQQVYEEMFEKGSCPYIYTWDGEKFTFFSDCLWAAPLGLQYAPGKFIPCRNWEYLKIPGELLRPKEGQYVLQITEELREAAYFDLVKLYAVDHPEQTEIYTNEKVGPPWIAQPKIHTVNQPRLPVAATDSQGNDALDLISAKDGRYFRGFEKRIGKGLAPLHYLELDFGDLSQELSNDPTDGTLMLFLNGWIRPTDCSLNISYAQNPEEPSPQTPVVLVPDQNGQWVKTIDPMGFPGGKPKTIAVDLSRAFLCNDYRIRIQTSHEIYWDQAFFTLGEQAAEFRQTELKPVSADLHYRGFSKRFTNGPDSPEVYDYQSTHTTPRWPAMSGKFTRYGDVGELLKESDDCSVVIGSGDEMTVAFEAISDPPPGWKRDFVIHLVGYDKDGDLNTVTGQSSEPLPFNAMKSYPWGVEEEFPNTPKHLEYLRKYQTRTQPWGSFWKRVVPTDVQ